MFKQISNVNKLLILVSVLVAGLGILNNSIMVSAMFICTIWCLSKYFKQDGVYDSLYMLLIVSAFYDYALYVPGISNLYIFHIMLAVMSMFSFFKIIKDRDILKKIDKVIIIIFIVWFVYMCLSVSWSSNKVLAVKYIAIYLMMFAFIINVMVYNINKENMKKTIKLLIILTSLITIIGFIEVILGKQLPIKHYADEFIQDLREIDRNYINARPIAFSFNPNNLAATLSILMPFLYCLIYKVENKMIKIFFTIISIISFIVISTTSSRTGFIATAIGVFIYFLYSIINIKNIGVKNLIYPLILILSLNLSYNYSYLLMNIEPVNGEDVTSNALSDKVKVLEDQEITVGGDGSLNVRVTIIKDVIDDIIIGKEYLGYGVGNVEEHLKEHDNTTEIYSPHCYAIEILGDFGVFGIALYGVYYLYLLINNLILTFKRKNLLCFASATGLLVFAPASFGPSSITYVFSYWIVIAMSICTVQIYKNK